MNAISGISDNAYGYLAPNTIAPAGKLYIQDITLRDGLHAMQRRYTLEQVRQIAKALDKAKVDAIEISRGDGLSGSSFHSGFGDHTDWDWIAAAASVVKHARLSALLVPGIGTVHDLKRAHDMGVSSVRIATHCTEADVTKQHIEYARHLDMDVSGLLMMSHMTSPEALAQQAKLMEEYGAHCVYVADSCGMMTMNDVAARSIAYAQILKPETRFGIYAQHQLSLGVANSITAVQHGATRVDLSLAGVGAGAGNTPMEVFIAAADTYGYQHNINLSDLIVAAETLVRPWQNRVLYLDQNSLNAGSNGLHADFSHTAKEAAHNHGIDSHSILSELGRRQIIGGQIDMVTDVALELSKRSNQQVENNSTMSK
ncbi:4-hydroxy-2-oxovalerate aldolase [Glaciimonas soli]|uniref:4-hydroxy-2-oxovalerate aldolase n=1 Tax=Glaciimonas soli TaxID=2590999 RepID=A0A843YJE6_9BURK|nr:4-hydroxy-2-oxovalerate aldolase [Glaciimonas soli]MQQ99099.1 4-hydroxy-2-oxovalerate aldolase [Glaciimonas soli]